VVRRRADNLVQAFSEGANEFQRIINLTVSGFGQLISNFRQTANQLSGPVGIVAIGADIARSDAGDLFQFAALISINLAFINILPLPALDGGQLAFLLIEAIRGKPLPTRLQESVMQTGLMLLLGLGIFLIVRDTANLGWVRSLLQQQSIQKADEEKEANSPILGVIRAVQYSLELENIYPPFPYTSEPFVL
jgi:RIP metalloprotease RseP